MSPSTLREVNCFKQLKSATYFCNKKILFLLPSKLNFQLFIKNLKSYIICFFNQVRTNKWVNEVVCSSL